jgi:hypothetical protein
MRVLRDELGDLSPRLSCTIRPTGYVRCPIGMWDPLVCIYIAHLYLSVIHRSRHLTGSAVPRVFLFDQNYIYYYFVYDLILNLIERLGLKWLIVFSVGGHIRVWILFCFIILFYLAGLFEISVYPKGFLLWPLVGTKSLFFVIIFNFIISRIINLFWWYGNWSHTLINLIYTVR